MQNKEDYVCEQCSYGEALQKRLSELRISQEELAAALGVTPKTIYRYVHDTTTPDTARKQTIEDYLASKSSWGKYRYMSREEFVPLLNSLLAEFKGEVTQAQLADAIGKYQKNISNYTCLTGSEMPDTKTQYNILEYFCNLCKSKGLLTGGHFATAIYLERLLYGEKGGYACYREEFQNVFDMPNDIGALVPYILSLPPDLRDIILDYFDLFFDDVTYIITHGDFHTHTLSDGIRLFRRLNETQQAAIVQKLEEDTFVGFPKDGFGLPECSWGTLIYQRIAAYHEIIPMDLQKLRSWDRDVVCDNIMEHEYIRHTEQVLTYLDDRLRVQEAIIREIEFKLDQTPYEWYVSMLFYIYYYKKKGLIELYQEMYDMI